MPSHEESRLGSVEYSNVVGEISVSKKKSEKNRYRKYSDEERFRIAQYAVNNSNRGAGRKNDLMESTVRSFVKKYKEHLKLVKIGRVGPSNTLKNERRGRPLMLGDVHNKVSSFLKAVRARGGIVNQTIAIATAKAIIKSSDGPRLMPSSSWAQSLFRRMQYRRRMATTSKVPIFPSVREEIKLVFMHRIVHKAEKFNIPPPFIVNVDQTPLKMVPVGRTTLAAVNTKSVPISGSSDKRTITGTFSQTLNGKFLSPQLIYKGKTDRSIPKIRWPEGFSLSANKTHFSNTVESLKFIDEILVPYFDNLREEMHLPDQKALLIWDAFRVQTFLVVLCITLNLHYFIFRPHNFIGNFPFNEF